MILMIVKAIYSLILPPAVFLLGLAVFALWLFARTPYRKGAVALAALTALLWFSATPLAGWLLVRPLEGRYAPPERFDADVIVMLTGGASLDTPNLDHTYGHAYGDTAGRLLTAARLQRKTNLPLLISGGQVFAETGNEADISYRELLGLGLPPERIMLDRTSRNTKENAGNSAAILSRQGWNRPLLVTSAIHMPRSVAEFHRLGVDVIPFPTDYKVSAAFRPTLLWIVPSGNGMQLTSIALKEYLGIVAIKLRTS